MGHEGNTNAIKRRAPCRLWNSLMSQCHVHSNLNLMSALLRQQVGLSAGRSTSIHPSFLPPCRSSPPHSIPSTKHWMQYHDVIACGLGICNRKICIVLQTKYWKCGPTKMDSAFLHRWPLKWRHPWGSWKGSTMTSLHRNQHAGNLNQSWECTCTKCLPWCHRYNIWISVGNLSRSTPINNVTSNL